MGIPNLPEVPNNPSTQQLAQIVGALTQELTYLLSGFLSSSNAREFGGWQVSQTEMQSKDEKVGMSTDKTGVDPIRFWAGDVKTGSPNFKVTESGIASMVAAFILSATGFPRVTFDSSTNTFSIDQSATSSIIFNPSYLGTTPVINFHSGSIDGYIGYFSALGKLVMTSPDGVEVEISNGGTSGDVSLRPVDNLNVPRWSEIINEPDSQSLQQALDNKQNVISGYSGSFSTGTQTVIVSNGIITSVI